MNLDRQLNSSANCPAAIPNRTGRRSQRGSGAVKAVVWTLVLASFVYVCFKVIPTLISEYEFQDGIQTIARFASVSRSPAEQIKTNVLSEAQKDDVPVNPEDVKVEAHSGNIKIEADYSVTIDLIVFQWTLNFHPSADNSALV
jgi:hypothetical protein